MSQKGKAGRDLNQVGRDFIQTWNVQVLLSSKFSPSFILFVVSVVAIAVDMIFFKHSGLSARIAGSSSLTGIVLLPMVLLFIGFIPILGEMGFIAYLFALVVSLQEPSFFPGSFGFLTGVMSGINFRKSLVG